MDNRLNTLKELYEIKAKKKYKKIICPNCAGSGYGGETLPKSECDMCRGSRFIVEEEIEND